MDIEMLSRTLLWSALINYGLLLLWFGLFAFARNWMRQLHGRWFTLRDEQFDAIHYAAMAFYKLSIVLFMLVPWLALQLAR